MYHVRAAREHFKASQNVFDRVYCRVERRFKRARLVEMEEVVTYDPKRFWDMLGKLGSRKSQEIPM